LTGIKEELEQAYQQIQTLTLTLDQTNLAKKQVEPSQPESQEVTTPRSTATTAPTEEVITEIPHQPQREQEEPSSAVHEEAKEPTKPAEVAAVAEEKAKSPRFEHLPLICNMYHR